ncbi:MAG: FkbM family methyltransferase [Phycisphaerales bacterium]
MPILRTRARGKRWVVGSSIHGCWLGTYEREKVQEFERSLSPGDVLFDIGANVGFYTVLGSSIVGPEGAVYAFEPMPRNLEFLRTHVSLNNLGNVQVIEAAVSDSAGTATFDDTQHPSMGSLSESGALTVRTVRIDDLVASGELPPPTVMKIDVEGAEQLVLAGAAETLKAHKPAIFLATHGADIHASCIATLRALGYELRALPGASLEKDDEILAV